MDASQYKDYVLTLLFVKYVSDKYAGAPNAMIVVPECQKLMDREVAAGKKVKDAQNAMDNKVLAQYGRLDEATIKDLVVKDKWLATLEAAVHAEIERVTQQLAGRVKTLEERYADPMPKLVDDVAALSSRVDEHLKRMGLSW